MSTLLEKLQEIQNQKNAIKGVLSSYVAEVPALSGYSTAFDSVISAQISAKISAEAERDRAIDVLAQIDALADSILA